jgi:hypothetical protein
MRYSKLILLSGLLLIALSCKKKEGSDFTNKLTFGTSINASDFSLVGEGTSFSALSGNVAFRLESDEDFGGNPVKFVIQKGGFLYSTDIYATNPKPTGHIFMTMKNYSTKGSYSVMAYIQKTSGDQVVASGNFDMN